MEIEITSQILTSKELYNRLIHNSNDRIYKLKELPKGTRPIATSIVVAAISAGVGGVVVALINSVKDYKIEKMKLKANEKEKEKDREAKINELKYQRETELLKIEKEKDTIGNIEIIGDYQNNILKAGMEKERKELVKKGVEFTENKVKIPVSLVSETIDEIDEILELKAITEIVQRNN